jgi:hypothetical protein
MIFADIHSPVSMRKTTGVRGQSPALLSQRLSDSVVGGINRLRLGVFAQHTVKTLHRVGGVDESPHFLRVLKIGGELCPVLFPGSYVETCNKFFGIM